MLVFSIISIPAIAKSDNPENEIHATMVRMERALNGSNINTLKSIYTDDAVLIPAEAKALNDKQAIVTFWNNKFSKARRLYHFDVVQFQVRKDIARLAALWSATVITPDIQTEIKYGYLTSVLKRQPDGSWKILEQNWD